MALTDDDPVDSDEEDVLFCDLVESGDEDVGAGSDGDVPVDGAHDRALEYLAVQSDVHAAASGEGGGCMDSEHMNTVRDIVAGVVLECRSEVEAAGYSFDESDAASTAAAARDGGDPGGGGGSAQAGAPAVPRSDDASVPPAKRRLPAGKMLVLGSNGTLTEVWISTVLALLTANARLSADRLVRIVAAARLSSVQGLEHSSVDQMVECGTACAVRYQDKLYFGTIARYGYCTDKGGMSSELTIPVSIHPDHKAKGICFWFNWLWEVEPAVGSQPSAPCPVPPAAAGGGGSGVGTGVGSSVDVGPESSVASGGSAGPSPSSVRQQYVRNTKDTMHTGERPRTATVVWV